MILVVKLALFTVLDSEHSTLRIAGNFVRGGNAAFLAASAGDKLLIRWGPITRAGGLARSVLGIGFVSIGLALVGLGVFPPDPRPGSSGVSFVADGHLTPVVGFTCAAVVGSGGGNPKSERVVPNSDSTTNDASVSVPWQMPWHMP